MKVTKATTNRLRKLSKTSCVGRILYDVFKCANELEALMLEFPDAPPYVLTDRFVIYTADELSSTGGYYTFRAESWEKPYLSGLSTVYPEIEVTFTHGNNECIIRDINKISRMMMQSESFAS